MDIVADFAATLNFSLDRFQIEAMESLASGRAALVAAPTGAGKTIVGEFCLFDAIASNGRAFYTTPIKALSNQKFNDLKELYGEDNVGLLTGDNAINGDAPLVVMTTEVLRNMLYERSKSLEDLRYVVLDEVHFLGDISRGMVWEEVIINLAPSVVIAALSATVSNAEEFGAWLDDVRGGCDVIISEVRPVPLDHSYAVGKRIYPMFQEAKKSSKGKSSKGKKVKKSATKRPNPEVLMLERRSDSFRVNRKGRRVRTGPKLKAPWRSDMVRMLKEKDWLPAIVFIFSRAACDDAVDQVLEANIYLTNNDEQAQIRNIIDEAVEDIDPQDLASLDFGWWANACERGIAAHHAGMVPIFKETTEKLFAKGLVKVVYATETLAIGINMPARTVVIERLEKWNGQSHELLTPGQFTQLTGRAGRRGKDVLGHAVVSYQADLDFDLIASLVGRRTERLRSRFVPNANMAVNLLKTHTLEECEEVLSSSFAQWQADTNESGNGEEIERLRAALTGYGEHLVSDYGDFFDYWSLRRELSRTQKSGAKAKKAAKAYSITKALKEVRIGDVIMLDGGRRGKGQLACVVERNAQDAPTPLLTCITENRKVEKVGPREFDRPPKVLAQVDLPTEGSHRKPAYRKHIQSLLHPIQVEGSYWEKMELSPEIDALPEEVSRLRTLISEHPVHQDPSLPELEVWAYRYDEVLAKIEEFEARHRSRTKTLSNRFISVVGILQNFGYLDSTPKPTEAGEMLAGIHGETDVVLAECLRAGIADNMNPVELAAWVSCFTFESRKSEDRDGFVRPKGMVGRAFDQALDIYLDVIRKEAQYNLPQTRTLNPELADSMAIWASGDNLEDAIGYMEISPGDFVRATKMCADSLRQIRGADLGQVSATAKKAIDLIVRGVVSW